MLNKCYRGSRCFGYNYQVSLLFPALSAEYHAVPCVIIKPHSRSPNHRAEYHGTHSLAGLLTEELH